MSYRSANAPLPDWSSRLSLAALLASVFSFSISFGGLTPLMALVLDERGDDGTVIGLVVAMQPIGTIAAAAFVPRLLRRLGTADAILACGVVSIFSIALLPVLTSVPAWLALRLVAGLAGAGPWIIVETWINVVASARGRGRAIALYASVMAAGFAAGPLLLTGIGSDGYLPFMAFALLHAAALLPILLTRRLAPKVEVARNPKFSSIMFAAPGLFAAAILSGVVDIAFFSFLPIWGMRNGLEESFSVALLTVFVAGNIVMQYPLGWLADVLGYRIAMILCGLVCLVGPVLAPQLLGVPTFLAVALFVWGGAAWGVYSIALAALGARFRGAMLVAANAVFVVAFEVANVVGPPAAGAAIDLWPGHGLMALMGTFGACFVLIIVTCRTEIRTTEG